MADPNELRMNLAAIKRVDPYAKDIVDSSAHVAFYTFNSEDNEWEKTDVEGAFFIYSRNAEPFHSIFINNRLNTNSFVEPITSQLELQSQPPFLLYRNERSRIRGFWFYNSSECDRIGELVGRLIKECEIKTKITVTKNQEMIRPMSNNVDIFSMLSKAQQDFNNSQNQSTQQSGIGIGGTGSGNVVGGSVNIISDIMNSRGKSSISDSRTLSSGPVGTPGSSINSSVGGGGGIMGISQNQPDVTSQSVMNFFAAAKPAAASEVPLFQRLLSNPVSVDQIEKQQRATTPQDGRISPPQLQNTQDLSTSPLAKFLGSSNVIGLNAGNNIHNNNTINKINNAFESGNSSSVTSCSTVKLDGNNIHKPLQKLLKKESTMNCGQLQLQQSQLQSSPKPALMPPTMFLSSSVTGVSKLTQQSTSASTTTAALSKPEPLTQTQLLQAMMYLIQNDPEFIKKLHEAYLKSFTDMVSL